MVNIVESKRREILDLARRQGVAPIRVFGSMARGDAGPQSDVDLPVEVGPDPFLWFPGGWSLTSRNCSAAVFRSSPSQP